MMEETLIRESAQKKASVRNINEAQQIKGVGPPVSFMNPANQSKEEANSKEGTFQKGNITEGAYSKKGIIHKTNLYYKGRCLWTLECPNPNQSPNFEAMGYPRVPMASL